MSEKTQMILGGVKFEAGKLAYDELEERFLYKWHTIERAKDSPLMQFQAEHKKSVTLSGTLSAIESGLNAFDELKAKAAKGEPMTLVDGLGRVHGLYVIENLRISSSAFLGAGVPRVLSFTLGLTEYERG